jgi:hypothetical protein
MQDSIIQRITLEAVNVNRNQILRTSLRRSVQAALIAVTLLVTLPDANIAHAQNTNATIRGQVLDPTGALVPNAQVVVLNVNTGIIVFRGKSDSAGNFVAPQVIPGTYKVTVDAPGLKETVIDNLIASVAQVASVNINMQIGQASETVTVESHGEELDRSTSDVSTLISPQEVQNLPLFGRAVENLLAFVPGVAHGGGGDTPSTSQLSINGSRTLNTEVLLNGVSTIVASTGTPATLPSPDAIDSFRVLTTNAPAEYGRTSGAVVSVNTISGTNAYHGNVYYLMRNEDLDANSYFNKLNINTTTGLNTPRAKDRYFQMGGSFGGVVRIPKIYNGHDKTFFYVNYDRTLSPSTSNLSFTVPTAAQRAGDLSNASGPLLDGTARTAANPAQTIYQPTGTLAPAFAGNQVGPIDPAAAKILALLPLPNSAGSFDRTNNRYTGNWTSQQNNKSDTLRLNGRVDEQITLRDRLSVNIYRYTTSTPNPISYNSPLLNTTWDCTCNNAWLPSVDYTRTWTPSLVMDLNMGFFRNVVLRNPPGVGLNAATALGIASLPLDQTPEITDPGFSNIGADTNTNQVNITNTFTPFGTITMLYGPHTFKFGASLRKNQFNSFNPSASPEGVLAFDGTITNRGVGGNANTGLADFLLGKVKTANYQLPMPETGRRNYNLGIFVQDDWKVTPKLVLNLGVRYEFESPMTIANDVYTRFDPNTGGLLAANINASRSLNVTTPKADVSPRIGLAYSLNDKTVFRAAFGTFYGTIFQNLGGQIAYPGYDVQASFNNLGTAIAQPFSLSQGLPLTAVRDLKNPFAALTTATTASPFSISGVSFNSLNPMSLVQQWNAGFERRLPLALTLEVNYVGNHALHLPYNIPANIVPLNQVDAVTQTNTTTAAQLVKPFPTLGSFTVVNNVGNSNYNALQVSVQRAFNKRIAVFSNYTFAKAMDDGSTIYNFSAPNGTANAQYTADGPSRAKDFAVSNIDAKHTLNIAVIYTSGGPWWLRNWRLSPVFIGHTGLPINITQSNEISNVSQQRPNGSTSGLRLASPAMPTAAAPYLQYFDNPVIDPTGFALTPSGPVYTTINGTRTRIVATGFGNTPRDSVRAPGEVDVDASVSKEFHVFEALKFIIRFDAFNVINHTNFSSPSGALTVTTATNSTTASFLNSSGFGRITGTQPPRRMQVSARFNV